MEVCTIVANTITFQQARDSITREGKTGLKMREELIGFKSLSSSVKNNKH